MTTPAWLDRRRAGGLLIGLLTLIAWGLAAAPPGPPAPGAPADGYGDVALYTEIAARVAGGDGYYPTAIQAQWQHGYPTAPFVVVRPPTLTWLHVLLGDTGSSILLGLLAGVALVAMTVRLRTARIRRLEWAAAAVVLALNLSLYALGVLSWFHEAWAGVLILIAVAVRTERRWWPSAVLGFAACCFRELAVPFLLVMAALSWPRRREFRAWMAAVAGFAVVYALHAFAVMATPQPGGVAVSEGWLQLGGWPFALGTVRSGSVLSALPRGVAAVVVPLALFGWLFCREPAPAIVATSSAFLLCFLVVGRPDNTYWGLLFAAMLLPGLALAPRGILASVRALARPD